MNDESFSEFLRTMRLMKSADPGNFSVERFLNTNELTEQQKVQVEKEFSQKKKIWIDNALFYGYFEHDSF